MTDDEGDVTAGWGGANDPTFVAAVPPAGPPVFRFGALWLTDELRRDIAPFSAIANAFPDREVTLSFGDGADTPVEVPSRE